MGFVAALEDGLTTYELPYEVDYPQVCLDEKLVPLPADGLDRLSVQPGRPERVDYEYERLGTTHLGVMVERLTGYRQVELPERRTAVDYAWRRQWLADVCYPEANKIRLVQDNLNTHRLANLYLVFPPDEAHRLTQPFEGHYPTALG